MTVGFNSAVGFNSIDEFWFDLEGLSSEIFSDTLNNRQPTAQADQETLFQNKVYESNSIETELVDLTKKRKVKNEGNSNSKKIKIEQIKTPNKSKDPAKLANNQRIAKLWREKRKKDLIEKKDKGKNLIKENAELHKEVISLEVENKMLKEEMNRLTATVIKALYHSICPSPEHVQFQEIAQSH